MPFTEVQLALDAWRQALAEAESLETGSDEQQLALEAAEECRLFYLEAVRRAEVVVADLEAETRRDWAQMLARREATRPADET